MKLFTTIVTITTILLITACGSTTVKDEQAAALRQQKKLAEDAAFSAHVACVDALTKNYQSKLRVSNVQALSSFEKEAYAETTIPGRPVLTKHMASITALSENMATVTIFPGDGSKVKGVQIPIANLYPDRVLIDSECKLRY